MAGDTPYRTQFPKALYSFVSRSLSTVSLSLVHFLSCPRFTSVLRRFIESKSIDAHKANSDTLSDWPKHRPFFADVLPWAAPWNVMDLPAGLSGYTPPVAHGRLPQPRRSPIGPCVSRPPLSLRTIGSSPSVNLKSLHLKSLEGSDF